MCIFIHKYIKEILHTQIKHGIIRRRTLPVHDKVEDHSVKTSFGCITFSEARSFLSLRRQKSCILLAIASTARHKNIDSKSHQNVLIQALINILFTAFSKHRDHTVNNGIQH